MGGSNLKASCTKLNINVLVFNNRNYTVYKRYYYLFASEVLVLRVIRVDAHCSVAHNGFRTCGGHYCIAVLALNLVAQIVELALLLLINNFFIR